MKSILALLQRFEMNMAGDLVHFPQVKVLGGKVLGVKVLGGKKGGERATT